MSEEFIIKLVSDDFAEGVGGSSGSSGVPTKGGKSGGIGGLAGKIGGLVSVAMALYSVIAPAISNILKPVMGILKGIVKLIAELLRPIVDILMIILRPILIMIKPLITLFKSFMAPFMKIARELSAVARKQFAEGNFASGMATMMVAIQGLIGPFVVAISSIALQLATTLIIGGITAIISKLLFDIGTAMADSKIGFIANIGEALIGASSKVTEFGDTLITDINKEIVKGTVIILSDMQSEFELAAERIKKMHPIIEDVPVIDPLTDTVASVQGSIDEMGFSMAEGLNADGQLMIDYWDPNGKDSLVLPMSQGLAKMSDYTLAAWGLSGKDSMPVLYSGGLTNMESSTNSFTDKMADYARKIKQAWSDVRAAAKKQRENATGGEIVIG